MSELFGKLKFTEFFFSTFGEDFLNKIGVFLLLFVHLLYQLAFDAQSNCLQSPVLKKIFCAFGKTFFFVKLLSSNSDNFYKIKNFLFFKN